MAGGHGHKFADLTLHAPKRWQVLTGQGMCAMMWLWVFYRAKQDGPVVLMCKLCKQGWRHPWDGHGHGHAAHGSSHGSSHGSGHGHEEVEHESQAENEGASSLSDQQKLKKKMDQHHKSGQGAVPMDLLKHKEKLEQHPKVVSLIEFSGDQSF